MQILKNENSHYQRFPVYEGNMFIHYEMCWEWQHGANIRQCELWLASGKKKMEWSSLETGQVFFLYNAFTRFIYGWGDGDFRCTQEGHVLDFSTVKTVIGWSFRYLAMLYTVVCNRKAACAFIYSAFSCGNLTSGRTCQTLNSVFPGIIS